MVTRRDLDGLTVLFILAGVGWGGLTVCHESLDSELAR